MRPRRIAVALPVLAVAVAARIVAGPGINRHERPRPVQLPLSPRLAATLWAELVRYVFVASRGLPLNRAWLPGLWSRVAELRVKGGPHRVAAEPGGRASCPAYRGCERLRVLSGPPSRLWVFPDSRSKEGSDVFAR